MSCDTDFASLVFCALSIHAVLLLYLPQIQAPDLTWHGQNLSDDNLKHHEMK